MGGMAARIAAHDWGTTPLGPLAAWPSSLKTAVHIVATSGQPMALFYGPLLTMIHNDGFAVLLGKRADSALGEPLHVAWFDVFDDILPMVREALAGETVWREEMPLTMTRNGYEEETWWTFSYSPVLDDAGQVAGFLDVVTEVTKAVQGRAAIREAHAALEHEIATAQKALRAKAEAEDQQRLLQRELVHRLKNMITVVQSITVQTVRRAGSLEEAAEAVSARLLAFARVQDIFTEKDWQSADILDVVEVSLSPYRTAGSDRLLVDGPSQRLNAQQSLALALAFHELATNATKYGSLAGDKGIVSVAWSIEGDRLGLTWRETGGPPLTAPTNKGFGSRLMERIVPAYFSGKASLDFAADGLTYRLEGQIAP